MRSIKFRVWDKESRIMCTVSQLAWDGKLYAYYFHSPHLGKVRETLDTAKNPLLQFTGLHDKNGKEIYEGDIVRWNEEKILEKDRISEIAWIEKEGCWGTSQGYWLCNTNWHSHIEVIGNIYENPELMGENNVIT